MDSRLQGVPVLVTRPRKQSAEWLTALQQVGAEPVVFPTLEIETLSLGPQQRDIILNLDQYQVVIVVSANAATLGLEVLSEYWIQWPVCQQWMAVGPATGEAMANWGLDVLVMQQGGTSETLLDLQQLQSLDGQKILILRGQGGRETLAETLTRRGAVVDYLELYHRILPSPDPTELIGYLEQDSSIILTVTSGEGLRNLMTMLANHVTQLQQCPLVVVSGRLARFARDQGFSQVWQAASPAAADVIHTLEQLKSRQDGE